jgi:four helix bundle protein
MAGVYRFEDLRVWQAAKVQSDTVAALVRRGDFMRDRDLAEQMNSASLSVMNNIAEGFLRGRDKEFLQFLRIAAGSNGEVRSCLHAAIGRSYVEESDGSALIERSNGIGRMIRRLQSTLGQK